MALVAAHAHGLEGKLCRAEQKQTQNRVKVIEREPDLTEEESLVVSSW